MIFFASVQLSLSVMGLMPMSEGLSLITVSAVAVMGCVTTGGGAEEADVEAVDEDRVEDVDETWGRT